MAITNSDNNNHISRDIKHSNITIIPYSNDSLSLASNDSRRSHATNLIVLTSPNMSYTGMGANRIESLAGPEVEQGLYPQEAATRVTPAMTDLLTTPQSGGREPRIGHGSSMKQPQELPASQRDQADADVMQLNERKWHKQPIVHGNGRSALRQRSNTTTAHDTWRVRRRRQRYKHRGRRTRSAQSSPNHIGQSSRVDGYNIRVNLAIGP